MADLYSGAYEFGAPEEAAPGPSQPHHPLEDPPEVSPNASVQQEDEEDSPPLSPPPSPPGGPPPLLYVRSERLQQLSRRLAVNADRSDLVHGLVEAYGLLEVRGVAGQPHQVRARQPPISSLCHTCLHFALRPMPLLACWMRSSIRYPQIC